MIVGEYTKSIVNKMNKTQVLNALNQIDNHINAFKLTAEESIYYNDLKKLYKDRLDFLTIEYAEILKRIRQAKNLTQFQLAKELGTNQKTLSFWENAQNIPNLIYQSKIKKLFDAIT